MIRIDAVRIAAAACLALSAGCISFGRTYEGNPIDPETVALLVEGETTRAQVMEMFGAPNVVETANITALAEQSLARYEGEELTLKIDPALFNEVYIYERTQTNHFILFLILFNYYSSDQRSDRLAIFFDTEGKVRGVGWTPGREGL